MFVFQVQERGALSEGRGRGRRGRRGRRPQGAAEARPHSLQGNEHGPKAIGRSKVGVARVHGAFQSSGGARTSARAAAARAPRRAVGRAARAPRPATQARMEPRRQVYRFHRYVTYAEIRRKCNP